VTEWRGGNHPVSVLTYIRPPNGMAASDPNSISDPPARGAIVCLSASELDERLTEEVNRAGRHHTPLSCLLVTIGNLDELSREHGEELSEQTFAYVGRALQTQLRRFDRIGRPSAGELAVVLPGADGPRGEMVARRVLERLRTIKVEADGTRRPLHVSVGLAVWQTSLSGEELLRQTRAAALRGYAADVSSGMPGSSPPVLGRPPGPA
jgi:diguanylate cyclase (GGDEF)-like protein